ncbi:MAG TPA: divalent-cation tolerance protein CutA [Terriglobales bacterium]|jgi:periplasmic divalent cation tolerance protein
MTGYVLVFVTCGSADEAAAIARAVVDQRLAACASFSGPVQSIYWWQGERQGATEYPLVLKTQAARFPELEATIRRLHSYETPEILAVPVTAGSAAYLRWIDTSVAPAP